MVRIVFSGAWTASDEASALESIRKVLSETLTLDVSTAFFETERLLSDQKREISLSVELFPAGSARARRIASQTLAHELERVAESVRINIDSPPQERGGTV